jgi:thiol:disulfide interchange protein DsbA
MSNRRLFVNSAALIGLGLAMGCRFALAAGKDGKRDAPFAELPTPRPLATGDKIEVIEFFWYGCPSCNQVEPVLETWEKAAASDVVLRREHALWGGNQTMEVHAKIFYTLRAMHLLGQEHRVVYDAIHRARMSIRNDDIAFDWAERRGIDRTKFEATYKSLAVAAEIARSKQMSLEYGIQSVPTFVVNGKYMTSPQRAGGTSKMFGFIDELIAKERSAKKR